MNQFNEDLVKNMWQLAYRQGGISVTFTKNFYLKGSLIEAQERARRHCTLMGFKYCGVNDFLSNLEAEEFYKLNGMTKADREVLDAAADRKLKLEKVS